MEKRVINLSEQCFYIRLTTTLSRPYYRQQVEIYLNLTSHPHEKSFANTLQSAARNSGEIPLQLGINPKRTINGKTTPSTWKQQTID